MNKNYKYKQVPYTRKLRQFKYLSKRINESLKNGKFFHFKKDKQDALITKLKKLYHLLLSAFSQIKLKHVLSSAFLFLGLGLSNNVDAQSFTTPQQNPFGINPPTGYLFFPTFADIDADGDIDLFIGVTGGIIQFFENTGTSSSPAFTNPQTNPFGITSTYYYAVPVFVDIDNDGDLDLFVGEYYGNIQFFENTGTDSAPAFASPQENPFGITSSSDNYISLPVFVDIDNDGDLDLFVGEYYGNIQFFENTGTDSAPAFANPQENPFGITATDYFAAPAFVDIDNDGDLDLFVGGYYYGNIQFFENTGTISAPAFANPQLNPFGITSTYYTSFPAFADIDNDGDLDLFVGGYYVIQFFEFINTNSAPTVYMVIPDQEVNKLAVFNFTFDITTFRDVDVGSQLTYSASLSDDSPLPVWLNFDGPTRTFSGTPTEMDNSNITVKVTATDNGGLSVNDEFIINVINSPPTVSIPIPDQEVEPLTAFNFTFDINTFTDVDDTQLTYSASLSNNSPLPVWLNFDGPTRTFSGTPTEDDRGVITVKVTATDSGGLSANDDFLIDVVTGLEDQLLSKQITLYPNPTDRIFELLIYNEHIGDVNIQVIDQLGRVFISTIIYKTDEELRHRIDLSGKSSGVYFVQIQTDNAQTVKRIINK